MRAFYIKIPPAGGISYYMKKRHRITHGVYMEKGMLYHQKNSIPFAFYVKFFSIVWRQITQISKVVNW